MPDSNSEQPFPAVAATNANSGQSIPVQNAPEGKTHGPKHYEAAEQPSRPVAAANTNPGYSGPRPNAKEGKSDGRKQDEAAPKSKGVPPAPQIQPAANANSTVSSLAPQAAKSEPPDPRSREVRLGLVLYGGVSLAIYMNGVTREFFRAVKGQGIYKLLKALTDSDIIVDIISATSAGGINGIMLAYALCNQCDFAPCADLWRRDGDVRALLRSPSQAPENTQSVLNSEGYYQPRLEAAYREMPPYLENAEDDPSEFNELDLFVTGTDIQGDIFTAFDDAGHPIDVKDHRAVFQLKHRRYRKEPFNPTFTPSAAPEVTYQALAKLSRITSCFPAAFAPVLVTNAKPGEDSPDAKLQLWGRLGKETYFIDGGILNNKPFTTTLEDIFYRMADRPVDRFLLYVEPDPERFDKYQPVERPKFLGVILDSLVSIPGYQSISADLQLLARHNSEVEHYKRVVDLLRDSAPKPDSNTQALYQRSRLVFMSERAVRGVLKSNGTQIMHSLGPELASEPASGH